MNIAKKTATIAAWFTVAVSCASLPAHAQADEAPPDNAAADIAGRFYVSPMYSHTRASNDRRTDDASGAMLAIGKQMNPYATLELYGSHNTYDAAGGDSDGKLSTIGLAVLGFPLALRDDGLGRWLGGAYAVGGISYAEAEDFPLREQKFDQNREGYVLDFGLGYLARLPFIRVASFRLDARYRMNFVKSPFASVELRDEANEKANIDDVVLSVGVLMPIGARPQPPAPPPPPQLIAPAPPPDTDGDGVGDPLDQCPTTPAGVIVDEKGCPVPVCDKSAASLSLAGCGVGDVLVLHGVNFEFDKARLTPDSKALLDGVGSELQKHAGITVELSGHTDSLGAELYNQRLSESRAAAVRDYLLGRGIDAARMTAVGYGESTPIDSNESEEGRERNRRVELKVLGSGSAQPTTSPAQTSQ